MQNFFGFSWTAISLVHEFQKYAHKYANCAHKYAKYAKYAHKYAGKYYKLGLNAPPQPTGWRTNCQGLRLK